MWRLKVWALALTLAFVFAMDMETGLHTGDYKTINCGGFSIDNFAKLGSDVVYRATKLNITRCSTPNTTFVDALKDIIDVGAITSLSLDNIVNWEGFKGAQLDGLKIKELAVTNDDDKHMKILADDYLDYVVDTLEEISILRLKLPDFPKNSKLVNVSLVRGFTENNWGGCQDLERLHVMHWVVPAYQYGWVSQCPKLRELTLFHAMEQTVRNTLNGATQLRKLSIRKCALLYITMTMFSDATQLEHLNFTEHSIYGIDPTAFRAQTKLRTLDMSFNELSDTEELALVYRPMVSLTSLTLNHNPLKDFCGSWNTTSLPIERLSLRNTQMQRLCFSSWKHLRSVDLRNNNITALRIQDLPATHEHPLLIDLRGNPITALPDSEEDIRGMMERFSQGPNVTVLVEVSARCDCRHAAFARALRALPRLKVRGVRCEEGGDIYSISPHRLECSKSECAGCACRRYWTDGAAVADCRRTGLRTLTALQTVEGLTEVLASGNLVDTLPEGEYQDSLEYIDLSDNRVSFLSAGGAMALTAGARRLRLAGNPLVCDCDTAAGVAELARNRAQILDFDDLICVNDNRRLSEIDVETLCDDDLAKIWPIIAALAIIVTVISILAAVYWKYEQQIKMYLFTRGCCLSCLREEDIDSERTFDAFIAFSHEDDDFVNNHLLPGLDGYSLCIHYRNWIAGDWIPAQIARSIEQSKRTIVVLSKSFLNSPWGMLEFRMAHAAMLHEGRARLIAVVLDDEVGERRDRLDAELRGYLAANTYVRWGDPWFFDKIRYALPHRAQKVNLGYDEDSCDRKDDFGATYLKC